MYSSDTDELRAARAQLVSYSARLLADGMAVGSSGNISVRAGDIVAITPSGIPYEEMRPADVCLVTLDGAQLPGDVNDTNEPGNSVLRDAHAPGHLRGDRCGGGRPHALARGCRAVCVARRAARHPLRHHRAGRASAGGALPRFGSAGLAAAAVDALAGRTAVILRNHGAVTYGRDLAQAYDRAVLLEWLARTYRLALSYGEPATLSAAELERGHGRAPPPPLRRAP